MDISVAVGIRIANYHGKFGALVQYFEYGRSVPGKLEQWTARPPSSLNLFDISWRGATVEQSKELFNREDPIAGFVVRSYGMSFVNQILESATEQDSSLVIDNHSGPAVPPNYTFALFNDDSLNRRTNDIVVLGILSSSVAGMGSFGNRTWNFEQPAGVTYPVYWPDGDGLRKVEPISKSADLERRFDQNPKLSVAWNAQLSEEDLFYSAISFGARQLDYSPLARLARRSMAKRSIDQLEAKILNGLYPYEDVLHRMIAQFAKKAREDGQFPIVMLIQSKNLNDIDVLEVARPILLRDDIDYLATVDHFDPRDLAGFQSDGHYRPEINHILGAAFLKLVEDRTN